MDAIIGVVRRQNVRRNLAGAGIHGEMELSPVAARSAVFLGVPIALAEQL